MKQRKLDSLRYRGGQFRDKWGVMSQFGYQQSYERNLPHLQPPEATLFVTFRLDGSIPEPVLEQWRVEKKRHFTFVYFRCDHQMWVEVHECGNFL